MRQKVDALCCVIRTKIAREKIDPGSWHLRKWEMAYPRIYQPGKSRKVDGWNVVRLSLHFPVQLSNWGRPSHLIQRSGQGLGALSN
jgi:hypothetical protein